MDGVDLSQSRYIFIDGRGGSGKTYLYNTIVDLVIGRGKRIACVAWTGIAANLLADG